MLFVLYLSIFLFVSSQANHCPDLSLPTDVPIEELRTEIFKNLHDRPNFPISGWSKGALKLRSLAFNYLGSNEFWKKTFGEQFTLWMTLFQNRYENHKPSACAIGNYLNGLAECIEDEEADGLLEAPIEDLFYYAANYFYYDGLAAAGCGRVISLLPYWSCKNNGLKYDITTIWNNNNNLPVELKNTVISLYKSTKYADRFLAALATFSISPDSSVTSKLDELEFLELVNAYNVVIGPSECCDLVADRLEYLSNNYLDGVLEVLENRWNDYKKPGACWQ